MAEAQERALGGGPQQPWWPIPGQPTGQPVPQTWQPPVVASDGRAPPPNSPVGGTTYPPVVGVAGTPENTSPPVVTGLLAVGDTLTTNDGTWTNNPTSHNYWWFSEGVKIPGTGNNWTYVLQASDVGHMMTCQVTAHNIAGSASALSEPVGPVTATRSADAAQPSTKKARR